MIRFKMFHRFAAFFLGGLSTLAQSQNYLDPLMSDYEVQDRHQSTHSIPAFPTGLSLGELLLPHARVLWSREEKWDLPDEFIMETADRSALKIAVFFAQAQQLSKSEAPQCSNPQESILYVRALSDLGRFEDCRQFAKNCSSTSSTPSEVYVEGASCAQRLFDLEGARASFEKAVASATEDESRAFAVYRYAQFAESTQFQNRVEDILALNPSWKGQEKRLHDMIRWLLTGSTAEFKEPEAIALFQNLQKVASGDFKSTLHLDWLYLLWVKKESSLALSYIHEHLPEIQGPAVLFRLAFNALYGQDSQHFKWADKVYKAALPYLHDRSWLPLESNVYNYTEIAQTICAQNILKGNALATLETLKIQWKAGAQSADDILRKLIELNGDNPARADLLGFIGGLFESRGDDVTARTYYWSSHIACPYYNRSHWGLTGIFRRMKHRSFNDYAQLLGKVDAEVAKVSYPDSLSHFVLNWGALSVDAQKRFKYAARFWAPWMNSLVDGKRGVYVKAPFELLSEGPDLEDIHDKRIDEDSDARGSYKGDNRLWDDVRGLGGEHIVADLGEMMGAPFGEYNLVGHEVTHGFHSMLPDNVKECVTSLYNEAKGRGVFADSYAASNEAEYFAQGVAYFMIPSDSPARFGINSSWIPKNDPHLWAFLNTLQSAAGDLKKVQCPPRD